ncbi:glycerol uptake facilitator-like aquaporin [Streptomyces sp. SAI-229]
MSNGDIFVGEVIGTAILILFGAGVVAAVVLNCSKVGRRTSAEWRKVTADHACGAPRPVLRSAGVRAAGLPAYQVVTVWRRRAAWAMACWTTPMRVSLTDSRSRASHISSGTWSSRSRARRTASAG